jgi:hypothetical protein
MQVRMVLGRTMTRRKLRWNCWRRAFGFGRDGDVLAEVIVFQFRGKSMKSNQVKCGVNGRWQVASIAQSLNWLMCHQFKFG